MLQSLGALLLACASCIAPPALIQATHLDEEATRASLALDAQRLELRLDDGTRLAGWYVPADEGAPLVLMLLESGASADSTQGSRAHLVRQLADLGFASLFIDYTGVGASGGKRSTRKLRRDARAMWEVALQHVDGDPGRVVLRATSLGTLAALSLIEDGARPAGVILLLPVLPDSVAARFARTFYGSAAGWLAATLFGDVVDLEPVEVIAGAPLDWMLVQADADQLTRPDERLALAAAVAGHGGSVESLPHDHLVATAVLLRLSPGEQDFLTRVVPGRRAGAERWARFEERLAALGGPGAEECGVDLERLRAIVEYAHDDDPQRLLAAAESGADPLTATRVRWMLARRPDGVRDLEGLCALADLDDPAGPLPLDLLEEVAAPQDVLAQFGSQYVRMSADLIGMGVQSLAEDGPEFAVTITVRFSSGPSTSARLEFSDVFARLRARGLGDGDARRQLARMLLKANRYPDRVVAAAPGEPRLECRVRGEWVALDTSPDAAPLKASVFDEDWIHKRPSPSPERP